MLQRRRALEGVPATIDLLPAVVQAVAAPILMDSGDRRTIDILRAPTLGARAILVGRPYILPLRLRGFEVAHLILPLQAELELAMALTGCATVADIDRSVLMRA